MKVAKDTFLIQVHTDREVNLGITGADGKQIIIDTDYNKYKHTVQIGKIFACPIGITNQYVYDTWLNEGDTVVFHHFVCQPDHKVNIGENIYRAEYFHIYAKLIGDKVIPLEDIIFVEPILEDESNLYAGNIRIKTAQENLSQQGIVYAASKKAKDLGVCDGDKVFFTSNADYSMKVGDRDLYRMRIRNIVAVERNGFLICLASKILVQEILQEKKIGKFFDVRGNSSSVGIVLSVGKDVQGVEEGDKISYFSGTVGGIEINGNRYSYIELRNINYVIDPTWINVDDYNFFKNRT